MPNQYTAHPQSVEERFWAKVNKTETCWLWTASRKGSYGGFKIEGKTVYAHRFAYERIVGAIPANRELDHLCRVRNCVKPEHLELVTHAENMIRSISPPAFHARKTHCPKGHPYNLFNTYFDARNYRYCKTSQESRKR